MKTMRLIDADCLKEKGRYDDYDEFVVDYDDIKNAPTIDPVKHGRWINAYPEIEPNPMFMYGICSECGFEQSISDKLNYCPNCGAKMDEEEQE